MPAQVADWSQVKATAIATGNLKDAAQAHGVEYDAIRQRASREQWPVGRRVHKLAQEAAEMANTQIIRASNGSVTSVTSAAEAAAAIMEEDGRETKLAALRYSRRTVTHAAELAKEQPEKALAMASDVKAAIQGASIAGDWQTSQSSSFTLNLFAVSQEREAVEHPAIDVEQA